MKLCNSSYVILNAPLKVLVVFIMANAFNLQKLVKHLVNGTFEQKYCRICLLPLVDQYEDIFTTIYKENKDYCIAKVLEVVCHLNVEDEIESKICPTCFTAAANAYDFYLQTVHSDEILKFYVDELNAQLNIDIPEHVNAENICISLPEFSPRIELFNYDFSNHPFKILPNEIEDNLAESTNGDKLDDNIFIIMNENGEISCYEDENEIELKMKNVKKLSRKRSRMSYKKCSRCSIQYRFFGKLKEHMKSAHDVDLFTCGVCKIMIEGESEYHAHLQTHTDVHTCEICNMVFKKRKTIIEHLKWHDKMKNVKQERRYVCETCGVMLASEVELREHTERKHVNRYTCYYCGKMYKMQLSFELHIKKHEMYMNGETKSVEKSRGRAKKNAKYTCCSCGRDFVDERALLWHERLHADERPYECTHCGRRFVSLNRRNQHALCSHTAPTRRCPLCPAVFHMRSMVNTHIKKVHLRTHKRRNRHCKRRDVFWKTATVPIQELSVSVQSEILKLQTSQET